MELDPVSIVGASPYVLYVLHNIMERHLLYSLDQAPCEKTLNVEETSQHVAEY